MQTSATLPVGDAKEACLSALSSALATGLGKPEQYVMVSFSKVDCIMFAGDSTQPAAFCALHSVGAISPSNNKKISAAVCRLLSEHIGIPSDRVYIQFFDSTVSVEIISSWHSIYIDKTVSELALLYIQLFSNRVLTLALMALRLAKLYT